ncbi:ATP-binding cassette domain-containing protein [Nocardia sp. NBC_01503]|uniref:ATP-binding cassette domain-containing protein n=1 Tax=Nocardia sp. NBC_01503 TaxID=2975997 RepID=UPI002E7B7CE3|nr:ATP-binding cassette domain-containing protein [Nocardia sp. NBC_01503]WTL32182.1 ATP-binding cassette domain-containing protein [Nocardia sp. NBC_01503]
MLDRKAMRTQAAEHFQRLGVVLPRADIPIGSLSGGQRQTVAVARAVMWASKVVFMDEPTAALGVVQRERVLDVIRRVRDQGISVVLISHNMPEVRAVADRIEVLRLGRRVARFTSDATTGRRPSRGGHRRQADHPQHPNRHDRPDPGQHVHQRAVLLQVQVLTRFSWGVGLSKLPKAIHS